MKHSPSSTFHILNIDNIFVPTATSIIGGAFAVSSQYVCEQGDDGNYTVKQEFYNSTSCDVDAAYAVTISTDQDYIDCESSGTPHRKCTTFVYDIDLHHVQDVPFLSIVLMRQSQAV